MRTEKMKIAGCFGHASQAANDGRIPMTLMMVEKPGQDQRNMVGAK